MTVGAERDPARERRILEERARALARLPRPEDGGETLEVAVFALGRERYAVDTASVLAVAPLADFAPIPRSPAYIVGLALFAGHALVVVDLGRLFGFERPGLSDLAQMIVLGQASGQPELGIVADAVLEVAVIRRRDLGPPPPSVASHQAIVGVDPKALTVLDSSVLLSDPRLFIDEADEEDDHAP